MCAENRAPRLRSRLLSVAVAVVVLTVSWPVLTSSVEADERVTEAQEERAARQAELDTVLGRIGVLEDRAEKTRQRLDRLTEQVERYEAEASKASELVAERAREAYKRGGGESVFDMLGAKSHDDAVEQARALHLLASHAQADLESATAARVRTKASAEEVEEVAADLSERHERLAEARSEAQTLVAQAEAAEQQAHNDLAATQRRRETAAEDSRQRVARASRSSDGTTGSQSDGEPTEAPASGGEACPVGQPRNYSDTYGAPRSGGRSHQGVDILAPRGTPIYAFEDGTISRMNSNRLGGISLYLQGDSGNQHYYTHLQGYVEGLSPGQRVSAGEQIAYNGDTGNARGIPHLHWEIRPGGGANVNPYPYARRTCG